MKFKSKLWFYSFGISQRGNCKVGELICPGWEIKGKDVGVKRKGGSRQRRRMEKRMKNKKKTRGRGINPIL